jgi:hypothetical protein
MPIWKLTPRVLNSPDWELSTYRSEVIVRARDEAEARELATVEFAIAAEGNPTQPTRLNPWTNDVLVFCETIHNSKHPDAGPAAVLSPRSS